MTFYRRNLPHWHPAGASLFVTWRLYGTLPKSILRSLTQHSTKPLKAHAGSRTLASPHAWLTLFSAVIVSWDIMSFTRSWSCRTMSTS